MPWRYIPNAVLSDSTYSPPLPGIIVRYILPLLLLMISAGCELLPASTTSERITLTNKADRPLVGLALARDQMQFIHPIPAFRAAEFQKRRLRVGETKTLDQISGFEPGDDLVILIYAEPKQPDPSVNERYGPGAAVWIGELTVTASELKERDNRIVISEL